MMKVLVLTLCVTCLAAAASANLVVRQAHYRETNWSIHLFLENKGSEPITVLPPVVDGFDSAALGRDGMTAGAALWYRQWPKVVSPGGIADLTIVLAAAPTAPVAVEVPTGQGQRIKTVVACTPEEIRFQAIRFSEDLRTVHVYVSWADAAFRDAIKSVRMDGRSVAKMASPLPAGNDDGLGYVRIRLPKPLEKSSFHVFEAETEQGLSTAYQIRAIPAEFLIGVYGSLTPANIQDWAAHGCNHYLSFFGISPEYVDMLHKAGLSSGGRHIPEHLADRTAGKMLTFDEDGARKVLEGLANNPGYLYNSLVDEPDCGDYYVGRRLGASAMELIVRDTFCREVDPLHYSFVQLDNTFRPRNYVVYGEIADVLATHRYSLGNSINREAGSSTVMQLPFLEDLRETTTKLRNASAPRPLFMVTQFFNMGPGRLGRAQTIDEMRLQCYAMIAGGARGIIHYIHSGSGGGHEGGKTPELWNAMTPMHEELMRVGEVVQSGTPAPSGWVKADSANVYADAVVSEKGVAVVLINRAHRSELPKYTSRPTQNVKVTVQIPQWMAAHRLGVVAADDMKNVASALEGHELTFTADVVKDARCYLLTAGKR